MRNNNRFRPNNNRNQRSNNTPNNNFRRDQRRPRQHAPRRQDENERAFYATTAIDPQPRIVLEKGSAETTMRAMDLICPIGMGQRGLIVSPPGSGKTTFLKHICQSVAKGYPDIKLYCLLVDERPEEVTDFRRTVPAEVRWSSTDESYEHHIKTADELMKEAYIEATNGTNVMVVIDSLTRLSRVHNAQINSGGRTLSGGVDARGLEIPRKIFGSARKIENGGSLSILATILVDTGSRMDQVIFEEFKGTGNMEIVLSREIAGHRIFPAIDIKASATRKEEKLLTPEEYQCMVKIRQALNPLSKVEAAKELVDQLGKFPNNTKLLEAVKSHL